MRTRNANSSKSATAKKTPPARKYTSKTRQVKKNDDSVTPITKSDSKPEQSSEEVKGMVDVAQLSPETEAATTTTKSAAKRMPGRTRASAKAVAPSKPEEQVEAVVVETPKVDNVEAEKKFEEPQNVEVVNADDIESIKVGKQDIDFVGQPAEKGQKPMEVDEPVVEDVSGTAENKKSMAEVEVPASETASISLNLEEPNIVEVTKSPDNEDSSGAKEGEKAKDELKEKEEGKAKQESKEKEEGKAKEESKEKEEEKANEESKDEETKNIGHNEESNNEYNSMQVKNQLQQGIVQSKTENTGGEEVIPRCVDKLDLGEKVEEEIEDDPEETKIIGHSEESKTQSISMEVKDQLQNVQPKKENIGGEEVLQGCGNKLELGEQGEGEIEDDPEELPEETETLEEEHKELTAIAKERMIKKEHEIFVGGLDHEATEEDLRKVFGKIGEVVEVRLHKNLSTNKNKGYAFVKFANKEHAKKALSEMKNPVIHGKRCGTAPSEDNDTLFLGNICNTWTKEAIKQKLKDYGVEGVENITLVPDVRHEGLSRGFAFLEFSCHADAMLAYKRLQKPDVIFGHAERTAKVAFAEPLREPDPEIMAQVKTVFVDGIPPHWDEDCVREQFKGYGEIVRIVLARNMSTAKRKDFGFVDFSTHEAAVACVEGVNKLGLGDGTSKTKARARLSNPLPKTQVVKGGMCGGFRIGHARSGHFPRFGRQGRGSGQGGHSSNWGNFNRDRNFYHGGRGQIGGMGFRHDLDFNNTYPDFHQRQFGPRGERGGGPLRGGHYAGGQGAAVAAPPRPYFDRAWYDTPLRGPGEPFPPRRPFSPEGQLERSFIGRQFDNPYIYDDNLQGGKRPFYMTDPDPEYMGPNRIRPRMDYTDPALFHAPRYQDSFGASSRQFSHDYYGSDYGGGPYSFYGGNNSYGRGHYY